MDQVATIGTDATRYPSRIQQAAKRIVDVTLGVPAALISLPLVVMISAGAALALRSTPLFTQERVGQYQRPFVMVKIRTLAPTAPRYAAKYDLDTGGVPRFTRWLRKVHLDELPQLWNVVTGSMALVGPRPEMTSLHEKMPRSAAMERTRVRPGCTGLWQLSPAAAGLIHESPEYDRFYIENQTIRLDLWILWQTARIALFRRPSITLDSIPEWTIRPLRSRSRSAITASPDLQGSNSPD